jgi:hypothetical protein
MRGGKTTKFGNSRINSNFNLKISENNIWNYMMYNFKLKMKKNNQNQMQK